MGNLLGEPFKDYVTDQINDRQAVHGKANRTIEELQYLNSRNAWIKLASGTSFTQDRLDLLKKNKGDQEENPLLIGVAPGQDLAIRNVLFNGLTSFGGLNKKKIAETNKLFQEKGGNFDITGGNISDFTQGKASDYYNYSQTQRAGIAGTNRAYGVGGTGQHGYSPMPGIIDADIKDLNRGSIKKATINIKAHNRNQFDVIDALYLRLGYSVMLEWGVDKYLDGLKGGSGDVESMGTTLIDRQFWKYNKSSYNEILPEIENLRKKYKGNYDGFFGVISNFSWTFEADGTYNIKLELMSQGDIIESLKANLPPTKNQDPTNPYDDIRTQELEATEDVTQDKFYDILYPGLKDLLTEWFNGGKYGFAIEEKKLSNGTSASIPYIPTESDSEDFPKLLFGNYINSGDLLRQELITSGTVGISGFNPVTVPERATLHALSIAWRSWVLQGGGEKKKVDGKIVYPKLSSKDKSLLDATIGKSKDIQRKYIMDNISLDKFLNEFFKFFKKENLAGGSQDRITQENSKTEGENKEQEKINARVEANNILEANKGKNKVFEYLYNIQKYEQPTSIKITALNKDLGVVINPSPNDGNTWNETVGFPLYLPTIQSISFNALTEEQQIKFSRKFNLTPAGYRKYYLDKFTTTVDVIQLSGINPIPNQHFIRLGTFLEFFETNIIPKIEKGSNKGQPLLLIDYNPLTNICYTIDNQISLNPTKTLISNTNFYLGDNTYEKIYPELNTFMKTIDGFRYGNLMNIYFSFNRIREIMDEVDTNNQISVYKVLKSISTDINESLGSVNNIEPIIDKESNTIRFIDQTPIPGIKTIAENIPGYDIFEKTEATLEIFGINPKDNISNFVRSAGITTEISKEYATIITIGATANGSIPGAEATAFSKWNVGIKDRFKENIIDAGVKGDIESQNESILKNYVTFLKQPFEKLGFTTEDGQYIISSKYIDLNKSSAQDYYIYAQAQTTNSNSEYIESSIGFLPFNLKLSMDGLSGIKIYNKIKVNTAFLPSNYGETLSFIVTGVNHKLSNNEWVTSLDTIATTKEKQDAAPNTVDTEELLNGEKQPQPQSRTSEGPVAPKSEIIDDVSIRPTEPI